MASDAYWNATKPAGMPDSVWQQQQAAQKAAQTAAAAATAAIAKKAAEEAAKKTSSNSNKGTYNTAKQTVANTNPTSYNTAQYYAAQALQNAGQTVPQPGTYDTLNKAIASDQLWIDDNTAMLEMKKQQARNEGKNVGATPIKSSNSGLTTEDARKEHITVMNDPTLNIPTDGEITLGWIKGDGNSGNGGGGNGGGGKDSDPVIPNPNPNPNPNPIPQPTGDGGVVIYPSGGGGGGGSVPSAPSSGYYDGANWSGGMSYKPYPTAEDMAGYVSTIIQAAKKELGDAIDPEKQGYIIKDAEKPGAVTLRSLEDLAETFGITYDYDSIYKIFNDSVEKQYDAIYQRQKQNEDKYYDNAAAAQNTLLDTLSRDRSNAVSAGVSKGMQAANALGAMLGVSQQFANNATALSQERSNTAKDYGASLAKAVVDAEATSNERKNAIMEISKMLYGYDSEQYVANMDNYNTILTNNAALQQSYMNNHTALQNALASIFGGVANNKIMGDANVQSSLLASEAQKAAAQIAASAQLQAAQAAAQAQIDTANINKELALRLEGLATNSGYVPQGNLNRDYYASLEANKVK